MINPHFYNDERSSGNLEERFLLEEGTWKRALSSFLMKKKRKWSLSQNLFSGPYFLLAEIEYQS